MRCEGYPSASALIGAAEARSARYRSAPAGRRHAPPGGSSRTSPATWLTPTRRTARVFLLGALYGAGIRHFDVASIPEIEDAATIPGAHLHFMHPVKSRTAIRRAFAEFGVRSFALDSEDELKKIARGDRRLPRSHPVGARGRVGQEQQDPARAQVRRHRRQGRAPAGQGAAGGQGARHHLPRRLADRDARGLRDGAGRGRQADRQGRRGARPPRRRRRLPVGLRRRRAGAARRPSCAPSTTASSGCRSASAAG